MRTIFSDPEAVNWRYHTATLWTGPRESGQHKIMQTAAEAELVKCNPAANQARFYRMAVWPDLFGGYSLAREYGRIGQPGRLRLDPYPDEPQAVNALHKLLRRKTRRGYQSLTGRSA